MKVLSLFDGISCGMVALERSGINIEKYVAYEIDKYAVSVSQKNYPMRAQPIPVGYIGNSRKRRKYE